MSDIEQPHKDSIQSGLRFRMGGAIGWCYLCKSEHAYVDPCGAMSAKAKTPEPCLMCGQSFVRSRHASHQKYCSPMCHDKARLAVRRAARI